jgi:electron-transferring-flavoprotein dehydrogenase
MNQPVERESMEVDVLYVGAGPATLASALHLMNQVEAHNQRAAAEGGPLIEPPTVLIIEKSGAIGEHILSGAVMNPKGIAELVPDFTEQGFPTEYVCTNAMTYVFTRQRALKLPANLPNFRKRGYHVVSLSNVVKWLGEQVQAAGIEITRFAGARSSPKGTAWSASASATWGSARTESPRATSRRGWTSTPRSP